MKKRPQTNITNYRDKYSLELSKNDSKRRLFSSPSIKYYNEKLLKNAALKHHPPQHSDMTPFNMAQRMQEEEKAAVAERLRSEEEKKEKDVQDTISPALPAQNNTLETGESNGLEVFQKVLADVEQCLDQETDSKNDHGCETDSNDEHGQVGDENDATKTNKLVKVGYEEDVNDGDDIIPDEDEKRKLQCLKEQLQKVIQPPPSPRSSLVQGNLIPGQLHNLLEAHNDPPFAGPQRVGAADQLRKSKVGLPWEIEKLESGRANKRSTYSMHEYGCRDCGRRFCRRGDRDNHEQRLAHTKWQSGLAKRLPVRVVYE